VIDIACEQVLECLKAEEAPLSLWLDVVKAYLAAGHTVHAEKMLREGTGAEVCHCPTTACAPHHGCGVELKVVYQM
jgi:hypothetical protein